MIFMPKPEIFAEIINMREDGKLTHANAKRILKDLCVFQELGEDNKYKVIPINSIYSKIP